jgi:hypothetical protein
LSKWAIIMNNGKYGPDNKQLFSEGTYWNGHRNYNTY